MTATFFHPETARCNFLDAFPTHLAGIKYCSNYHASTMKKETMHFQEYLDIQADLMSTDSY